jgi:hypothetical protein
MPARCWAFTLNLKAYRCGNSARKGHWFCYQHRRWLFLRILAITGIPISAFFLPYLWGLLAPPTTVESRLEKHVAHIENLLENKNKNPQPLTQFLDDLRISKIYPLAYALFYADGRKVLYSAIVNDAGIDFEIANIRVVTITDQKICISGFRINVQGSRIRGDGIPCFIMAPGTIMHFARAESVVVDVLALGGSVGGGAWIIGVKSVTGSGSNFPKSPIMRLLPK